MKINDPKNRTEGNLLLGIDIGSTTAKLALIDDGELIYSRYERHFSQVRQKTLEMVEAIKELLDGRSFTVAVSGSAGMGMANAARLSFVQEVYATAECVRCLQPDTDAVIELGGEDAKIIFFTGGLDERMNGSCAGGTGAFIDQMATLLNLSNTEMDELSLSHQHLYPIASRCGVFAKTDIQPLINQGATKADIAASIYQAVVNQTVGGLAQGREIAGNILYLGGPLTYLDNLRKSFDEALHLTGISPENALLYVAYGAALQCDSRTFSLTELAERAEQYSAHGTYITTPPLFSSQEEYDAFCKRHHENSAGRYVSRH